MKHFKGSILLTIIGIILAYFWGIKHVHSNGLLSVFVVLFLAILEVTLSFDNAVVNAMKLEKMSPIWQRRFLTWGIIIAVFGMRLLFPIVIVSIFSGLSILSTFNLAIENVTEYTKYLHLAHVPLVTFGGAFLLILALQFFINQEKEVYWLKPFEKAFAFLNKIPFVTVILTCAVIFTLTCFVPQDLKMIIYKSGGAGILTFLAIHKLSELLEKFSEKRQSNLTETVAKQGFVSFIYLELIDASFSLDGVLGAFAISKDIIIIMIGLSIGAMFVRSLTVFMVEKKTLKQFKFLESGAHWAILLLALIMFVSVKQEVPEVVTGLSGLLIVGSSFVASIMDNKKANN